jgi:hypothetical protein
VIMEAVEGNKNRLSGRAKLLAIGTDGKVGDLVVVECSVWRVVLGYKNWNFVVGGLVLRVVAVEKMRTLVVVG